jgi:hypothetical protein
MSAQRAVRSYAPTAVNPALRLIQGVNPMTRRLVSIVGFGLLATILLGLVVNVCIAQNVYEMASLKARTHELTTTAQVLREQVDSLGSNQNLEQAAHDMGMVSNSNPVFLDLANQQVYGHPKAARAGVALTGNLVSNAALTATTNVSTLEAKAIAKKQLQAATAAAANLKAKAAAMNVAAANQAAKPVSLPSSGIPGSPTN